MMLSEFVDKLIGLKRKETITVKGEEFILQADGGYKRYQPAEEKRPARLDLNTLSGLVDLIHNQVEELPEKMFLHVVSPREVVLLEPKFGHHNQRSMICAAEIEPARIPEDFGDQEEFLISLMTLFDHAAEGSDIEKLIQVASHIVNSEEISQSDDGISQEAILKMGVANKERKVIENPVKLAPFVTFPEIEQPLLSYIYRMQKRREIVTFSLYYVKDPRWEIAAKQRIVDYFESTINEGIRGRISILK